MRSVWLLERSDGRLIDTNICNTLDDAHLDATYIASMHGMPRPKPVEFAEVIRHPGTEPPKDARDVLVRRGSSWGVGFYSAHGWRMSHGVYIDPPIEWTDLPPTG